MELVVLNSFLKKVVLFLNVFLFAGMLVSCSSGSSSKKVSLSANEVYEKAVKGIELPSLEKLTSDELSSLIGLKTSDVEDLVVYMSPMNVKATEIGIFKFDNSDQENSIDKAIESRLKDLENSWKRYLPDQYELVKNAKKFEYQNVKGYIVAEDADKIVSNIEAALK